MMVSQILIRVVSYQGSLSDSHQGGLSDSHQGGPSDSHQCGLFRLSSGWSLKFLSGWPRQGCPPGCPHQCGLSKD